MMGMETEVIERDEPFVTVNEDLDRLLKCF